MELLATSLQNAGHREKTDPEVDFTNAPAVQKAAIPILVSSPEYFIREHCLSLFPDLESALSMK